MRVRGQLQLFLVSLQCRDVIVHVRANVGFKEEQMVWFGKIIRRARVGICEI